MFEESKNKFGINRDYENKLEEEFLTEFDNSVSLADWEDDDSDDWDLEEEDQTKFNLGTQCSLFSISDEED